MVTTILKSLLINLAGANLDSKNPEKQSALYLAAFGGNPQVVQYIISKGAIINDGDVTKWTPLHIGNLIVIR
jgi:ankyrin repeat protein